MANSKPPNERNGDISTVTLGGASCQFPKTPILSDDTGCRGWYTKGAVDGTSDIRYRLVSTAREQVARSKHPCVQGHWQAYGGGELNNWVKIEYGDITTPSVAFFADGSSYGWGGIFGGTKKILEAVKQNVHECRQVSDG